MGETEDKRPLSELPEPAPSVVPGASGMTGDQEPVIAPGEALQLVRFQRDDNALRISGLTPHGRNLTFEQREDREGWFVVVAGRRRRPTQRELALVVASISREMEAAMGAEGEEEVRSAYRLAASSDQPGLPGRGIQAYRDLLIDEASSFIAGQTERLAVVAIEYQAFKRFALRHGHRIGQAFVRALGERLDALFRDEPKVHVCHKAGKSFRMIIADRTAAEVQDLVQRITSDETRQWVAHRVWGDAPRTHPDEVNFYIGIAVARPAERDTSDFTALAQRLNDDAFKAAKLGQMSGHTSIQLAKMDYRTTVKLWSRSSQDEIEALAAEMDDGPAEVMAETVDYLNELVPADLEGMAVQGDVSALIHKAIARDGFWQGTTAMRIAGEALIDRFLAGEPAPEGQNDYVGGFDLGDEFYGISIERDHLYFCWGDLNSAGATRTRAGLQRIRDAVGWRRKDGGGIVGRFLRAVRGEDGGDTDVDLPTRVRQAVEASYREVWADPSLHVNDGVDIAEYLWTGAGELARSADLVEGATLELKLPDRALPVRVVDRRSNLIVRLDIDGQEHVAAVSESRGGLDVKLRVRDTVISAAVSILRMRREDLLDTLAIVREDNGLRKDHPMNIVGFLRHIADLLLADEVKTPGKILMALGEPFDVHRFVQSFTMEDAREQHPGLFYEAVHQELLVDQSHGLDENLAELVARTMLARTRPSNEA